MLKLIKNLKNELLKFFFEEWNINSSEELFINKNIEKNFENVRKWFEDYGKRILSWIIHWGLSAFWNGLDGIICRRSPYSITTRRNRGWIRRQTSTGYLTMMYVTTDKRESFFFLIKMNGEPKGMHAYAWIFRNG